MSHHFNLTKAQCGKLERGEPLQFSHRQLECPNEKEKYGCEIHLNDEGHKKVTSAIRQGKGFRLHQGHYTGFGLLDDVKNFAKKHGGKTAEALKKAIPKSTMGSIITNGLTAAGVSPATASVLSSSAVAGIYATNFAQPIAGQTANIISGTVKGGLNQYSTNQQTAAALSSQGIPYDSNIAVGGSLIKHGIAHQVGNEFKNLGKGLSIDEQNQNTQTAAYNKKVANGTAGPNKCYAPMIYDPSSLKMKMGNGFTHDGYPYPQGAGFYSDISKAMKKKKGAVGAQFASELAMTPIQIKMAALRAMRKTKSGGSFIGGSFRGGAMTFSPESQPIVNNVRQALAKYQQ